MNAPASIYLTEAERAATAERSASGRRKARWMAAAGRGWRRWVPYCSPS
jgi:hypothetical protein